MSYVISVVVVDWFYGPVIILVCCVLCFMDMSVVVDFEMFLLSVTCWLLACCMS
jgi:hypothetical protein